MPQQNTINSQSHRQIDEIVGRRNCRNGLMYKVRWKHCSAAEYTWEPLKNLIAWFDLIREYEKAMKNKEEENQSIRTSRNISLELDQNEQLNFKVKPEIAVRKLQIDSIQNQRSFLKQPQQEKILSTFAEQDSENHSMKAQFIYNRLGMLVKTSGSDIKNQNQENKTYEKPNNLKQMDSISQMQIKNQLLKSQNNLVNQKKNEMNILSKPGGKKSKIKVPIIDLQYHQNNQKKNLSIIKNKRLENLISPQKLFNQKIFTRQTLDFDDIYDHETNLINIGKLNPSLVSQQEFTEHQNSQISKRKLKILSINLSQNSLRLDDLVIGMNFTQEIDLKEIFKCDGKWVAVIIVNNMIKIVSAQLLYQQRPRLILKYLGNLAEQ